MVNVSQDNIYTFHYKRKWYLFPRRFNTVVTDEKNLELIQIYDGKYKMQGYGFGTISENKGLVVILG
jgi:hypothetical protein